MTKNIAKIVLAAMCSLGGFAAIASTAGAANAVVKHPTYALGTAKHCKTGYAKMTERHKVSVRVKMYGKLVTERVSRRYIACVYVGTTKIVVTSPTQIIPVTTVPVATATLTAPTTTTVPAPTIGLGVSLDPSYVQNPNNPFQVTYAFSASAMINGILAPAGQLPAGVLNFFSDGSLACAINVGASTTSGQCPVTYASFGDHTAITEYLSGTNSATSGSETNDIEPSALAPEIVIDQWGTTAGTGVTGLTANVVGLTAAVVLTDPNFEGATSVGITDNLGDKCSAVVSGTSATCSMSVTGATPTAFIVNYSGGTPDVTTQTVSPWGVSQTQQVTYDWPSENVAVTHPVVTSQSATVLWNGGHLRAVNGSSFGGWSGIPSNPIIISQGQGVVLGAYASGSLSADQYPLGAISYVVGPMTDVTMIDDQPASSSVDCSGSYNYSNEAVGVCNIMFSSTGTYTITIGYVSDDPNYASSVTDALTETVIVN